MVNSLGGMARRRGSNLEPDARLFQSGPYSEIQPQTFSLQSLMLSVPVWHTTCIQWRQPLRSQTSRCNQILPGGLAQRLDEVTPVPAGLKTSRRRSAALPALPAAFTQPAIADSGAPNPAGISRRRRSDLDVAAVE